MGGRIGVTSTPGTGTLFWLELRWPLAVGASRAADAPSLECPAPVLSQAPPAPVGNAPILLAEDNEISAYVARTVLAKAGYQVDVVASGTQALAALRRRRYGLVFMDMRMPAMSGLEALQALARLVSDLGIDAEGVMAAWRHGSVVRSWLLDLMVRALQQTPDLDGIAGVAQDSGEGRWTIDAAIDHAVPIPAISAALFARFASRQDDSPAMKVIATLRNQFGGHDVQAS